MGPATLLPQCFERYDTMASSRKNRKIIIRTIALVVVTDFLSACGGYVPHQYPPLMVSDSMTRIATNKNFKAVDSPSFGNAVMLYPTRLGDTYHSVPIGDYLLSRVVLGLPEDAGIAKIRLDEYKSKCESRIPHFWCTTSARLAVTAHGSDKILDVTDEVDVGPRFLPGDISFPFTTGDFFDGAIHAQARKTVDGISIKILEAFSRSRTAGQ